MAAQQPADLLLPMFRKEQRHLHLLINAGYGKRVAAFLNMIFIHGSYFGSPKSFLVKLNMIILGIPENHST